MTRYVLGLAFSPAGNEIALIEKRRGPASLIGYWNGIGGKVEPGERWSAAMAREFAEEAGVETSPLAWDEVAELRHTAWTLVVFQTTLAPDQWAALRTVESEPVARFSLRRLPDDLAPNLHYLIPLALDPTPKEPPVIWLRGG